MYSLYVLSEYSLLVVSILFLYPPRFSFKRDKRYTILAERKKIFYANKKYKVGFFSQHLWILVSFVLRIQTKSIRLVSFHSTYRFLVLRIQTKNNGFARSMRTRSIRLVSFHSTYGFLYPLFYAFKQEV